MTHQHQGFSLRLNNHTVDSQIDYFNNQIIVDLVEQQHKGIFSVLDEACMNVGKVTDEVFLQGLNVKLAKHAHYTSRKVGGADFLSWRLGSKAQMLRLGF